MSKLITRIKRLALALCLATPIVSWAGLPTVTVNGNDVTISFDSGKYGNIDTNNGGSDTITIPAATDLDSGTVLLIKSISLGSRDSGAASPASITVAGVNSDAAVVTEDVYGTNRDKYTYNFSSPCLVKVGTASSVSYKNANGEQVKVGLAAALISEAPDSYVFGWNSYSFNQTHTWGILSEIVAEKVTGYINETNDGFNTTVTSEKVYVSGVTGYLNTIDAFGFGTVDELVVVDGEYTYGYKVVNGNSPQNNEAKLNRAVAFKKLSGTGTITNGDHGNGPTPVMGVCDSSEFAGSINIGSATTRLSVLFCTEAEISAGIQTSLGDSLYNLFAGTSTRSRIYVSAGRTTANNAVVTVPAGKTWTAVNGIVNKGELVVDGTVSCNIVNDGTLTVNGTVTGTISGSGTVVVNEDATIASFGSQRDFTGWTIHASDAAKITMSAEEYGKGSVSVTGADGISSITVLAPDGTTTVGTITPAESSTLETDVKTSGLATWCDYEFNGDKSNSGVNKTGLTSDVDTNEYPEIFNNQMLYTYTHPYRGITYPDSWTAVVRCTVPELENAVVVMFGTYAAGAIGLAAGPNPEEQMLLVSTPGAVEQAEDKHFTTLATMNVKDATTAQHVYVFTKDGTTVNVYCDGEKVLENYELASATLGGGLQIGSLHGGVVQSGVHTGLVRFGAGESQISSLTVAQQQNARIDCMRMYDYIVSPEQVAALSVEFPAVKLYRATVADGATTDWGSLTWTPGWDGGNTQSKVILTTEGDAVVALPNSITVDEVQLDLAEGSTLTLTGPGELAITQPITIDDGTLKLTGTVTLTQDTALNGSVVFDAFTAAGTGALKLSNGATAGVASGSVVVTPLGDYTRAEGTVVDSSYTGAGVKLMPLTSAACSLTSGTTVRYYSDATGVFDTFRDELATDEALVYTILDDTDWSQYAGFMVTWGYYFDQTAGTIELAAATIAAQNKAYTSLSAAVADAAENDIVKLFRDSSEAITLNKAITLNENGKAFSGTLTGNGTLTFTAFRNNPSITFTDWTGTVVLPSFTAGGTIFNKYGVTDSKVVLKGIDSGWLGETGTQRMDVEPTLQLDGNVTITGFSTSWDYTFAEITGTGTFSLDPANDHPKSATITKVAEDFSGIITNNADKVLTIGTLERADGTSTTAGTRLLATGGNVVASALKIGGEASTIVPMTKNKGGEDDGIYVPVTINVPEVANTTVAVTGDATGDQPGNYEVVPGDTITVTYTVVDGYEHTSGDLVYVIDSASAESVIEPDIVTTPYVASITSGEEVTKCTTLAGAFNDAIDGDTVTLLADVAENVTIASGKTVTLDLGGKTLTATGDAITNNGTLTLQNGAITATGAIVRNLGSNSAVTVESGTYTSTGSNGIICGSSDKTVAAPTATGCSVTVNGGTFNVVEMALATGRTAGATITVNGGTFTSSDNALIGDNGTAGCSGNVITVNGGTFNGSITTAGYIACGIYVANNDTVSVNGGTFTITGGCGIAVRAGVVTVADGVTIAATGTATGWVGDKKTKLPCAAVIYDVNPGAYPGYDSATSKVAITGGTLTSDVAAVQMFGDGLVTTTDNTLTVAEGYKWAETATAGVYQLVVQSQGIDPDDPESKQEVVIDPTGKDEEQIKEAAVEEAAVTIPEAVSPEAKAAITDYKSYFELKATVTNPETGACTVEIVGFKDNVVQDVNEDAVEALKEAVADTEATTVAVKVPAGLYYVVETYEALGTLVDSKEGWSTGTTTPVDKPTGTTQGFIRVRISTAEITD